MEISFEAARAYLERDHDANLMLLGALMYDPVRCCFGTARGTELVAAGLVAALSGDLPSARPTVLLAADDSTALTGLFSFADLPASAIWSVSRRSLLAPLEQQLGARHNPQRGQRLYVADRVAERPGDLVRRIRSEDADTLDLSPCGLSPTALSNWLRRDWRMFGVVADGALLCHALAAYPLGDTEEISAVFTAPNARRRGLASAVVAATAADILRRGCRPIYVTARTNRASRRVAENLGFRPLGESWEIVT